MKKVSTKQSAINRKLHDVYEEIRNERDPYCEGCGRTGMPLSNSHVISQSRCKQLGKPELIWDKKNIYLECFTDSDSCHRIWEDGNISKQMKMHNFIPKVDYIKRNDAEQFRKMTIKTKQYVDSLLK